MSDKKKLKSMHAPKGNGGNDSQEKLYSSKMFEKVPSGDSVYYFTKRLAQRAVLDDEKSSKWALLEPSKLTNYIRLEKVRGDIKRSINSGKISKSNIVAKVKEAIFVKYNKKTFENMLPVNNRLVEKHFGDLDYWGLQMFKTSGDEDKKEEDEEKDDEDEEEEDEDDELYNKPQDTSLFDIMMTAVQREILGEWRRSNIADLTKLADSLEDTVGCTLKILRTQINHIEVSHVCQLVRKCLYEVFDDEKVEWAEMSLGGIMALIEKKMKFVHDERIDKSQKLHGLAGEYFGNVMALKEVVKSTDVGKAFEEVARWVGRIDQETDECEVKYPNYEKMFGQYVNATKCAMVMRQLLVHGAYGKINELDDDWLLNIPNFQEFYERENGLPKEQRYLKRVCALLKDLNYAKIMFALSFELKQSCGVTGPVRYGREGGETRDSGDKDLILDGLSLGLKAIKVSDTKSMVPYNKWMESEIYKEIENIVTEKFVVRGKEEKIQGLINYAKGQTKPSHIARLRCVMEQSGFVVTKKGKGRDTNVLKFEKAGNGAFEK